MLPPRKSDIEEPRHHAHVFAGCASPDAPPRRDDPDHRLVAHWQRLFAHNHARKAGSA